jgi:hypothetical protein
LATLPYAKGASWNPSRGCLSGTRTALLTEIFTWITNESSTTQLFWLADVAGAGKSSVAHSVAQWSHERNILASSFFFDREVAGRNNRQKLFSTIARDLANVDASLAQQISIEQDSSLPTAPIPRLFDELVLKPSLRISNLVRPVVIVVDALDEGYDHDIDLLTILRDQVPHLPRTFRLVVTSRAEEDTTLFLHAQRHIERRSINIHDQPNNKDIVIYIRHRLKGITARRAWERPGRIRRGLTLS